LDDTSSDDDDGGPVSATGRGQPQPSSLEIGNLQNQLSSTQRSLTATQSDRQALEKQLNTTASQLSQLESQLASTKASYETETRLLADLREKFASQSAAINKAKEELIRNESDLSALKLERNEVQSSVLSGKDEIRDVERKMREVVGEIEGVKKEVEDGRKEGKVASALVEVKKRQLEGLEEELEGVKKDAEAAREEVAQAKREVEVLDGRIAEIEKEKETHQEQQQQQHIADISRAKSPPSIPLPETPADALSPAGSAKSNNPFDRLFGPSSPSHSELPYSSPFPTTQPQPQTSTEAPLGDAVAEKEKEGALSDDEDPFGFNSLSTPTPKANEVESKDIVSPSLTAASAIPLPTSPPPALNLTTSTPTTTITTTLSPTARDFQSPSPSEAEHEFHTPPSTAPLPLSIRSSVIATDDDGDDALLSSAAEQFPALEDVVGGGGEGAANADELPPLKEVVEDDTSDESDDDDEPLGKKIMEKRASMAVEEKMKEGNNGEATNVAASVPAPEKEQSAPFDAIFGTSNTTLTAVAPPSSASLTPTPTGQQSPQSAQAPRRGRPPPPPAPPSRSTPLANKSSASPFDPSSIFTPAPPPPQPQPHTNGVGSGSPTSHKNLVDEAFGIIAPRDGATGLSNAEGVKFDTSFDDTFVFDAADTPQGSHDFGTSKSQASNGLFASAFDPPPSATSAKSAVPTNNGSSPFSSFDDAFGLSSASSAGGASHTNVDTSVSNSLTFDDAFHVGVRDPSSGTTDSEAFGQQQLRRGVNERSPAPVNVPSRTSNDPSTESPVSVSDHGGFHGSGLGHSQSVVRDRETPPRVSSPKFFGRASSPIPRTPARKASTASSSNKGLSPEEKEKTRHSKLSLHFPGFGKSKAKKQAQQQELKSPRTPGAERSSSIGYAGLPSGAAGDVDGDDVDGVKTLVGMGFTRIQAVEALERNSYDVPAALNNLLGSV
jgi:epidermal growth factor receptor substrate 15